jgi:hypothetical protein
MRWPAAMFFAAVCAVGCRSTRSTTDPFFRTTIPPPGTGAASGAPDAYYTSPAPPYGAGVPSYQGPIGGAPATGGSNGPFAPSGYPQGSPSPAPANGGFGAVPGPVPTSQVSPPASQAPRLAKASYVTTADAEPSAVYQRRSAAAGTVSARITASDVGASSTGPTSQAVDIMDLPPVLASR